MLPSLSNVLRRDKERQRATAAGPDALTRQQSPPPTHSISSQSSAASSSSNLLQSITPTNMSPRNIIHPTTMAQQSADGMRTSPQFVMLPEEHRAREREKEKQARAQLGNAYTQQMMANRQVQQNLSPTRTQQLQGSGQGSRYSSQHMESSVTRLLVATKMLLESLTKWSLGQKSETQVSDIYVRLGNDFNIANVAFESYGIDMSDLVSVPDDLRTCLELCLSEDPSPQTLEIHLPRIREIIIGLLQGLKAKQAEYKQFLVQNRASARQSKSRMDRIGVSEEVMQGGTGPGIESDAMKRASSLGSPANQQQEGGDVIRRSILGQGSGKRPTQPPPLNAVNAGPSDNTLRLQEEDISQQRHGSTSSLPSGDNNDSDSTVATAARRRKKSASSRTSRNKMAEDMQEQVNAHPAAIDSEGMDTAQLRQSSIGDTLQRHTLTDEGAVMNLESKKGATIPTSVSYSTPTRREAHGQSASMSHSVPRQGTYLAEDAIGEMGDAADPSVRALKSRDALERRASKRFSAYTFNKMGVGLNQGMGMSSYALNGMGAGSSGSPMLDRRETGSKLGGGSRRGVTRASSETPQSEGGRDYFTPSGKKMSKAGLIEDVAEEGKSPDSPLETPSKRSNHSRGVSKSSPRANLLKLPGNEAAASSTDSLPFVDAASSEGGTPSPRAAPLELREELKPVREEVPPVPPLPSAEERARLDAIQNNRASSGMTSKYLATSPSNRTSSASGAGAGASHLNSSLLSASSSSTLNGRFQSSASTGGATSFSLFLQLGRQTRRTTVDLDPAAPFKGLTIGKLRMLFMDKFSYSPGKEDFPTIYLKDAHSGVTYELEDLDEVGEGSVLTLNIEPLDQVKQHLDLSLSSITRELRELKTAVFERDRDMSRRLSVVTSGTGSGGAGIGAADSLGPLPTLKISDAQFAMAGAKVAKFKRATMLINPERSFDGSASELSPTANSLSEDGGGVANWRTAGDQIKQQYGEVQKLRRQLAIVNQIQTEFKADVGGLLGALREQTSKVRNIAANEVPTERNFIIAGKARLDASSQEILTLVEDLLDAVDDLKADVIQRGVKPKPNTMKQLQADISRATKGLEDLSSYVGTVKPSWKKTWELELQNIVDEQEFLNHQEGLISDLQEDHYSLQEVFQNIQEVVKLRGANKFTLTAGGSSNGSDSNNFLGGVALKTYVPPAPEEGHEGLSTVMLEVKSQAVDHEKRLKALQAAERQRQKERSQRTEVDDEFQHELTTFVDGKILRKTGGYQEAERVRSRRDKLTIQAMFSGGTNNVGGAPIEVKVPPPPKKLNATHSDDDTVSGGDSRE